MVLFHFRVCKDCGIEKPISEFYIHGAMKDGYLNSCKECVKHRVSDHYYKNVDVMREKERLRYQKRKNNLEFKKRILLYQRKWRTPGKNKARNTTTRKLKKFKPSGCSICGKETKLLHAHHKDYSKPDQVVWCCPACHAWVHSKKRRREAYAI